MRHGSSRFPPSPTTARRTATATLVALATRVATAHAQTPAAPNAEDAGRAAVNEATTPLPVRATLSFKPSYTFPNGSDRYTAELQFEGILPYDGFLIPHLDVDGIWSVARVQLSGESLQNSSGPASGITDLNFVDLAAARFGSFDVGAGLGSVFPMATTPALGQGKLQVGPAVAARFQVPALKVAALVQNLYSVAGNSQSAQLAYVSVQPLITVDLPDAFFLSSDATMYFYWAGGQSTVPVDLGFGRGFGEHFVGSLQFWYTLAGKGQDDIEVRAVLSFLPGSSP